MSPKVSVIVPVYNAAPFLPHCLETLAHQTLQELEIILVLDCPTDGSDRIAEEYARQCPRIRLLRNEKNLHAGESRNRGLAAARGEYIGFSDADDFQELCMYEEMYRTAVRQGADVVLADRRICIPGKQEEPLPGGDAEVQGGREFLRDNLLRLVRGNFTLHTTWLYTHLYRREFLERERLRIPDSRRMMAEDLLFNIRVYHRLLQRDGRLVYLPRALYHYVVYEGSLCHSPAFYTFGMTRPLLEEICTEMQGCTEFPAGRLREALGCRIVDKLYAAFTKEVRRSGWRKAYRQLLQCRRAPLLRQALREYRVAWNPCLPPKKNVFACLLRRFIK